MQITLVPDSVALDPLCWAPDSLTHIGLPTWMAGIFPIWRTRAIFDFSNFLTFEMLHFTIWLPGRSF